jgi:hypothetical protein
MVPLKRGRQDPNPTAEHGDDAEKIRLVTPPLPTAFFGTA